MPKINDRIDNVRSRAMEIGVYLPLGAYARVRDEIADLDRKQLRKLFDGLIDRGQDRLEPIEKIVRRRGDDMQKAAKETGKGARKVANKASKRATAASAAVAPRLPRVAAPRSVSELPISGYKSMTASDVVARLQGLTQTDLAKVYKYEQANDSRRTILDAIEGKLVDLPIPTYDALNIDELNPRLENLSKSDLKTVRRYEADTKARSTVIEKIDSLLSA